MNSTIQFLFYSQFKNISANSWRLDFKLAINSDGSRIYGGQSAEIGQVPHQVSIYKNGVFNCGGSIVSKDWIVTASHCLDNIVSNDWSVYSIRSGSIYHNTSGTLHTVANLVRHEDYGLDIWRHPVNDIAVIRVNESFIFDKTRQPIELFNEEEESPVGAMATVSGWGYTETGLPGQLQVVQVPIIEKNDCYDYYQSIGGIPTMEICAGYADGGKDACSGDSGGPLVIEGRLAGIASWGRGCAQSRSPGVYTEIASYRLWIKENSGI